MSYDLKEINLRTVKEPRQFAADCESRYMGEVKTAAEMIAGNAGRSPIVLLSGPSGSGKTTTARKISEELNRMGVGTHYISMDDYYNNVTPENTPRTPEGEYDLESPLCLDMELMNKHFAMLAEGEKVFIPKFEFARKMRSTVPSKAMQLKKDEIVIVEGIHALNDMLTEKNPEAFKLYISAKSDIEFEGKVVFKSTWFRLVRRTVRDYNFRGTTPAETLALWANVRRGEKLYITPFKDKADFQFDTAMACEPAVLNRTATELFMSIPQGIERYDELCSVLPAIELFGEIDESLIDRDSLLREFIGGGIYSEEK